MNIIPHEIYAMFSSGEISNVFFTIEYFFSTTSSVTHCTTGELNKACCLVSERSPTQIVSLRDCRSCKYTSPDRVLRDRLGAIRQLTRATVHFLS